MPEPQRDSAAGRGVFSALFDELRRRRVIQVAGLYLAMGAGAIQGVSAVLDNLGVSRAVSRWFTVLVVLGFPLAVLASWAYDLRLDREHQDSVSPINTRVRLLFGFTIVVGMVLLGVVAFRVLPRSDDQPVAVSGEIAPVVAVLAPRELPHEGESWAGSLADQITTQLSGLSGVTVRSYDAVASYASLPFAQLVAALDAKYVVSGTLGLADGGMQLMLQVIDGESGSPIAVSERFTADSASVPAAELLAERGAEFVLQTLGARLRIAQVGFGTRSGLALKHFYAADKLVRRALQMLNDADKLPAQERPIEPIEPTVLRVLDDADAQLTRALDADADWDQPVLLRARLNGYRAYALRSGNATPDRIRSAFAAGLEQVAKLLDRNEADAQALWVRGWLEYRSAAYLPHDRLQRLELRARAKGDLSRALAIDPDLAPAAAELAELFYSTGAFEDARFWAEHAFELDEFRLDAEKILYRLALATFETGNDSLALSLCQEVLQRFNEDARHHSCVLEVLAFGSLPADVPQAWQHLERLRYFTPSRETGVLAFYEVGMASVLARAGLRDSADHQLARVRERYPDEFVLNENMLWLEAAVRFRLAQADTATKLLRAYLARGSRNQNLQLSRRAIRPYLDVLYKDRGVA